MVAGAGVSPFWSVACARGALFVIIVPFPEHALRKHACSIKKAKTFQNLLFGVAGRVEKKGQPDRPLPCAETGSTALWFLPCFHTWLAV
jgi:hypothetical protein